jgi:N-methylhydantoinase B/oxoprolinase/acetone carboxylase alpha subunit
MPAERALPPKVAGLRLVEGDAVTIVTPGAGGYGPPDARDAACIARDLAEGKVSAAHPGHQPTRVARESAVPDPRPRVHPGAGSPGTRA